MYKFYTNGNLQIEDVKTAFNAIPINKVNKTNRNRNRKIWDGGKRRRLL